jgi:hypothetical protein
MERENIDRFGVGFSKLADGVFSRRMNTWLRNVDSWVGNAS